MIKTAKVINGKISKYDWVITVPSEEYGCLVGMIFQIDPFGSPDHETKNETDDIHVNFMNAGYSDKRKNEIAEQISELYGENKPFDELPLDDVIMYPDGLIRITDIESCVFKKLLESYENAEAFCNQILDQYKILECEDINNIKIYYSNIRVNKLIRLGYSYYIMEGGYISKDKATIIIDNRQPYIGQILALNPDEQKHRDNLHELISSGALVIKLNKQL